MIVLEGCNGEWAQKCYLPFLVGEAAKGNLELRAVDIEPRIRLSTCTATLWKSAQSKGQAFYLNKSRDKESYEKLTNVGHVFIVTPPRYHCDIAGFWLERLVPDGKIFIEKPLDVSVGAGLELGNRIDEERKKEVVFGFDHYLAKAYPFLRNSTSNIEKIGGETERIEFHILEDSGIPPEREKALDKGMIFDLFSHVLAVICATLSQRSACSETILQTIKLEEIKAAKYAGSPISSETFASIKFTVDSNIEAASVVGMCVGVSEDKFMRLYGPNGTIELNLAKDEFFVLDSKGREQKQGKLNAEHVKSFLEGILQGNKPLSVPGVLSFDAALGILEVLDKAKAQIDKMPEYQCGESVSQILERL